MKISFFSEWLAIGGTERIIVTLANAFVCRGYQVDIILLDRKPGLNNQLNKSINVIHLDCRERLRASILPLAKFLYTRRPDIIMPMSSFWAIPVYIAKQLVANRVRIIPAIHFEVPESDTPPSDSPIHRFFRRHVLKSVPHLVTVSRDNQAYMIKHFDIKPDRVHVINNPAVSDDIMRMAEEPLDHPWFSPSRKVPLLINVGRLSKEKDHKTLFLAFKKILEVSPARLCLIGEGVEHDSLFALVHELAIQHAVQFIGSVSNPYKYMRNSDLLVLSSRYESFGLVLAEAMACGTPVVSTRSGTGPVDILENGIYGKLVPRGDVNALAQAILDTINGQPSRSSLQQRAQEFSVEKAVEQYLNLFESTMITGNNRYR